MHLWEVVSYLCYLWTHLCLTKNAKFYLWEGNPGDVSRNKTVVHSNIKTFSPVIELYKDQIFPEKKLKISS